MVRRRQMIRSLHIPASGGSEHLELVKHAMHGKSGVTQLHWESLVSYLPSSVTHLTDTD